MAEYVLNEKGQSIDEILARAKEGGTIDFNLDQFKEEVEENYVKTSDIGTLSNEEIDAMFNETP